MSQKDECAFEDGSARPSLPPTAGVGRVCLSAPGLDVDHGFDPSDRSSAEYSRNDTRISFEESNDKALAFTLVELLVVISIIGILIALIAPSFNGILGANNLGTASETVLGALSSARQLATTKNREVEVRLLVIKNPDFPNSSTAQIRGIQLMQVEENGTLTGVEKPRLFPNGIISGTTMVSGTTVTTLASGTTCNSKPTDPSISTIGKTYQYYRFSARPDGSFNLGNLGLPNTVSNYYLTLYDERRQKNNSSIPLNFSTIQLEPFTGETTLYRP